MPQLVRALVDQPRSGIREVMDAAWAIDSAGGAGDVIGLHVGESSYPVDPHVVRAVSEAMARGETRYVPNTGIAPLRAAVADKLATVNRIDAGPEQVVITNGGMDALFNALTLVVTAGDEVLIPDPGWPNFESLVVLLQGRPVRYPLRAENGFQPDAEEIAGLVSERTVAILVNSPSNPMGTVFTEQALDGIERLATEHDLWVISDECYDQLVFDGPALSPAARPSLAPRVLSCFSFSKTYAMTGMRVGYVVTPPGADIEATSAKVQEPTIACVNAPAQWGALAALQGPQEPVAERLAAYRERRDAAMGLLDELGIEYHRPDGAFYLWLKVADRSAAGGTGPTIGDVHAWSLALLADQHVAVAPGTTFGPRGAGWIRICVAPELDQVLEGIRRIAAFG